MEHRHGAAELGLDRWVAGNREIHFAQFAHITCGMLVLGKSWCHECGAHSDNQHDGNRGESLHTGLVNSDASEDELGQLGL